MRLDPLQTGSPFAPGYTPPIVAELVPIGLRGIPVRGAADLHAKAQQLTGQEAALASQHGNLLAARSSAALMLGCTWLLLKLGLLGHGFVYLGKREVQATMH